MSEQVDTGFDAVIAGEKWEPPAEEVAPPSPEITATVSGLTEEGKDAAKALVSLPATLDRVEMAKLAREIAMDIKERAIILRDFGLTQAQYDYLSEHNDYFKNALQACCLEWHSPLSTVERVKLASAAILEDALPAIGARMQNKGEGLPGVVEAAKFFAKNAGIGERDTSGANAGERFVINIDLGGDQKITLSTADAAPTTAQPDPQRALPAHGEAAPGRHPVQPLTESAGGSVPIRQEPEGS